MTPAARIEGPGVLWTLPPFLLFFFALSFSAFFLSSLEKGERTIRGTGQVTYESNQVNLHIIFSRTVLRIKEKSTNLKLIMFGWILLLNVELKTIWTKQLYLLRLWSGGKAFAFLSFHICFPGLFRLQAFVGCGDTHLSLLLRCHPSGI
jgi:hypothetical protein